MYSFFSAMAIIIAAISILLQPSCASHTDAPDPVRVQEEIAEYRQQELELVRSTVSDHQRADRLIHLLSERDRLVSNYAKEISAYREQMSALNADYNAERESFDMLMASYNSRRVTAQKEFTALVEVMKNETTAEEWKKIIKYQLKRLHPRRLSYGQASRGF